MSGRFDDGFRQGEPVIYVQLDFYDENGRQPHWEQRSMEPVMPAVPRVGDRFTFQSRAWEVMSIEWEGGKRRVGWYPIVSLKFVEQW